MMYKNTNKLKILRIFILSILVIVSPYSYSENEYIQCKDFWNVQSQWDEMKKTCELGVKMGDPLSQVATAMYLLSKKETAKAQSLLLLAAENGYDDAYYWLGESQTNKMKAISYYSKARGTGGYGLLGLVTAAEIYFNGEGVEKNFEKAQNLFRKAIKQTAVNLNNGVPKPPGEWWSNAKWRSATGAISMLMARYGFKMIKENNKIIVQEVEPLKNLTVKELMNKKWKEVIK